MASISAVNTFALRDGVSVEEFEQFSRELDRPTCLAFDEVEGFEVYFVERGESTPFDVLEVLTVSSWSDWVAVRDNATQLAPVVARFDELVDTSTVTTYFTRRSPHLEES